MKKKLLAVCMAAVMMMTFCGCSSQTTGNFAEGSVEEAVAKGDVNALRLQLSKANVEDAANVVKTKIEYEYASINEILWVLASLEGENSEYITNMKTQMSTAYTGVIKAVEDLVAVNEAGLSTAEYYLNGVETQSINGINGVYETWNKAYVSVNSELQNRYVSEINKLAESINTLSGNLNQLTGILYPQTGSAEVDEAAIAAQEAAAAEAAAAAKAAEEAKAAEKAAAAEAAKKQEAAAAAAAQAAPTQTAPAQTEAAPIQEIDPALLELLGQLQQQGQ